MKNKLNRKKDKDGCEHKIMCLCRNGKQIEIDRAESDET